MPIPKQFVMGRLTHSPMGLVKILPHLSCKQPLYFMGDRFIRMIARIFKYPVIFAAGWLFNFVYDAHFISGFMAGWLGHTWIGEYLL